MKTAQRLHLATIFLSWAVLLIAGCGTTQVSPANRRLLEALQTAVSAENSEWLEAVSNQMAKQKSVGQLSEAEFQAFDDVIRQAQAGDWKSAQAAVLAIGDGQRPTAEDLTRLQERKPAKQKK
jgi:hypothetical protein